MAIQGDRAHQIKLLQENLQTIRKIAGWSIEDLGERIGVTKQTISNLENSKTKMSLTQYIAIRAVLDYEAQEHPENDILPKAVHLLLDEENNVSEEEYQKIRQAIDAVAAAASGGADHAMLSKLFSSVIGTICLGACVGLLSPGYIAGCVTMGAWIKRLLKDK